MAEQGETLIIDATPEQNKETLDREQELIQIKKTLATKYGTNLPDLTKVIASIIDTKPPEQKPRIIAALLSLPNMIASSRGPKIS